MIADTVAMEFVVTRSEAEALLLESNLIKRLKPRYNVLLRDDKTFPNILICAATTPSRSIAKHRGATGPSGDYFGPFASAGRSTAPSTPCSAPSCCAPARIACSTAAPGPACCTRSSAAPRPASAMSTEPDYAELVDEADDFLSGRSQAVQDALRRADEGGHRARWISSRRPRCATASAR